MVKFKSIENKFHATPAQPARGVVVIMETLFDGNGKPYDKFVATFNIDGITMAIGEGRTVNSALVNLDAAMVDEAITANN